MDNGIKGIGERIAQYRKMNKWTQKQLGENVGESPQVISNWEREYSSPDKDQLDQLSTVLGVSVDYLIGKEKGPDGKGVITIEEALNMQRVIEIWEKEAEKGNFPKVRGKFLNKEGIQKVKQIVDLVLIENEKDGQ